MSDSTPQICVEPFFSSRGPEGKDPRRLDTDINGVLESDLGKALGYELVKFIGGADEEGDYSSSRAIKRAIRNLDKFAIVGAVEYMDRFLQQFENRFSVKLHVSKLNKGPVSKTERDELVTERMKERIRKLCQPDYEVYNYIVDTFVLNA